MSKSNQLKIENASAQTWEDPDIRGALADLPDPYELGGKKGDLPAVKMFTPDAQANWVLWAADEQNAFGLFDTGEGSTGFAFVAIAELERRRGPHGMPVMVDPAVTTRFEGYESLRIDIPEFLKDVADQQRRNSGPDHPIRGQEKLVVDSSEAVVSDATQPELRRTQASQGLESLAAREAAVGSSGIDISL